MMIHRARLLPLYDVRRILESVVMRLSDADYRQVLEVVGEAVAVDGRSPFPAPVLDALRRLVPCDVVAFHEQPNGARKRVVWTGEPRGPVTRSVREAQKRFSNQDPLTPTDSARKYSDFFSQRSFHRLGLYQEVARPLGVEDMIRLWLDSRGAGAARFEFDRPDWGFCERDRVVLELLRPHLKQFWLNALRRRRPATTAAEGAALLTEREREVLELVAEGRKNAEISRLLWISPGTVRKHLEHAYEKLEVHTRTAAVAAARLTG